MKLYIHIYIYVHTYALIRTHMHQAIHINMYAGLSQLRAGLMRCGDMNSVRALGRDNAVPPTLPFPQKGSGHRPAAHCSRIQRQIAHQPSAELIPGTPILSLP